MDLSHHLPDLYGFLAPKITAAYLKIALFILKWAFLRRRALSSSSIEPIATDAEIFADLADWLTGGEKFECLGFKLGDVALSSLGCHLMVISSGRGSRNFAHLMISINNLRFEVRVKIKFLGIE